MIKLSDFVLIIDINANNKIKVNYYKNKKINL